MSVFDIGEAFAAIIYIFLPLILGLIHIKIKKKKDKISTYLRYYLVIGVGIQGLVTGLLQMNMPAMIVSYLQWCYSPFLLELGTANLCFGILGLYSACLCKGWQLAAATGYGLFLFFTGIGHIVNLLLLGFSTGDGGAFIFSDLLVGFALLLLVALQRLKQAAI